MNGTYNGASGEMSSTIRLNVVLYREGEYWVGHCVELDIATSDPDQEKAWRDIQTLIRAQITYATEKDSSFEHLFRPNSAELSRMVATGRDQGEIVLLIDGKTGAHPSAAVLRKTAA